MNKRTFVLSALCLLAGSPAFAQSDALCPVKGHNAPASLHEAWILEGWEKTSDDPVFVFAEKLGRYYDLDGAGVYYDDLAPDGEAKRTPSEYGAMWEGPFNSMTSVRHAISDGPNAIVGDTVSSSTLEFVALLESSDGTITAIRDRSQLGWECLDGRWVIRHEHNSARTVNQSEIAPYFANHTGSGGTEMATHPYIGMWVTEDNRIRQELKPDGRYAEARGTRENAYTGRYEVTGDEIQYWDDSGFTADGHFVDDVLYHAGMVMHRKEANQ